MFGFTLEFTSAEQDSPRKSRVGEYFRDITGVSEARGQKLPRKITIFLSHLIAPVVTHYNNELTKRSPGYRTEREKDKKAELVYIESGVNALVFGLSVVGSPYLGLAVKAAEIAISRTVGRSIARRAIARRSA